MREFLINIICVMHEGRVFQQTIGIPVGIDRALHCGVRGAQFLVC